MKKRSLQGIKKVPSCEKLGTGKIGWETICSIF